VARIDFDPAGVVCTLEAALPEEGRAPPEAEPRAADGGEARGRAAAA
jgi:hypothetical protein